MLASGCALHVEAIHGGPVKILTGADAGKTFTAVMETLDDLQLATDLGNDPRAHRILRFRDAVPALESGDNVQTEDGKKWRVNRRPDAGYLSTDFELMELVDGQDT